MKREYVYTVHVVVEDGHVIDDWVDEAGNFSLEEFCADAVELANDADAAAAEEAADKALEARKERQA